MKLYCSVCHTCWEEQVLSVGGKCPFKDCAGWLSSTAPQLQPKPKPKPKPTFPLLEDKP